MEQHITTEALERLCDLLPDGPWAFEAHGDTGEYGVGYCEDEEGNPLRGEIDSSAIVIDPIAVEVQGLVAAMAISLLPDLLQELLILREYVETQQEMH